MARPDSMRNSHDLPLISGRVLYAPVINTIAHAITRTTDVHGGGDVGIGVPYAAL